MACTSFYQYGVEYKLYHILLDGMHFKAATPSRQKKNKAKALPLFIKGN